MSCQIPTCEFTGNRCVKDTCDNCGIYAINYLAGNIAEATEKVGNEFCKLAGKIIEEEYDKYYDTAGNLHWIGTKTGEPKENK